MEFGRGTSDGEGQDEVEKTRIHIMRALVNKEDPSSKDVDDLTLRRFLRARELDVDKASKMFLGFLRWRRTFVPRGSILESEVPNEISQNKFFMQGTNKLGRPIVVLYGARHKPSKSSPEEFKRFVVFCFDKICSRMPAGQERFVAIADLQGWAYANSDIRGYLAILSILQDCYPERLEKLLIIHVPYVFMTAWKMVYPFIDSRTKRKIVFVENNKLLQTLLEDIDESQLPDVLGGKLALVPIQDC
ncbi:hypothetical protein MLD38_007406 [Melastoma candidum]|uniref:Uncharacterized protein n=1 Tax=Melastoma candidum TaxID=119954 RepID=A0ACB9RQR5_9MYRT|nr:hypothetical protein MLD38_007406 [Melastoma candidum]